jgi:hypothetical protein
MPKVIHDKAQDAARSDVFDRLARFGWGIKGVLFGLVGTMALLFAVGGGGETTDQRGALDALGNGTPALFVLGVIAFGLVTYGLWRVAAGVLDVEGHGKDAAALAQRATFVGIGIVYLVLAATLIDALLAHGDGPRGESDYRLWTSRALKLPAGPWLVGGFGVATIISGLVQFVQAYRASFLEYWEDESLTERKMFWFSKVGRFGFVARGVVFVLLGVYLIRAGLDKDPGEARNVGEVFGELAAEPFLLAIVAAGFIAFGVHCLLDARYRHVTVDRHDRHDEDERREETE